MADEKEEAQTPEPEAPDQAEGNAEAPADGKGAGGNKMFSKAGILIFASIILLEAAAFSMLFLLGGSDAAQAEGPGAANGETEGIEEELETTDVDIESLSQLKPYIIDLDEVTVYPQSTQSNAPHRITAEIQIVLSDKLGEALMGEGKDSQAIKVIKLNLRQVLKQMLEEYGVRVVDGAVREAFQHEAKTRLNNVQVEGDRELLKIIRLLRGHVRQVMIDRLQQASF